MEVAVDPGPTDLRPEANPLPFFRLTAVQQEAYRRLVSMLVRAVNDVGTRAAGAAQSRLKEVDLDFGRKSRVAVVSGSRGTGKTSVVLSVLRDLHERQKPEFGSLQPSENERKERAEVHQQVESLFNRVFWLDMLDMSPLPASANLFSAILVRIEEAISRRLPTDPAKDKPRSYLDAPEVYDSPLEKLRRLQTDVAVSWEGNLPQRAGAMDANAFAAEVRRVEHVRLKLNARLTEVLDELAPAFSRRLGGDGNALFVLPVDDFDLNPPRCLELLEMLRTLSVPRLFFLVLGDVDVAEIMCGLQLAGGVARISDPAHSDFLPIQMRDVQATIINIAGNVIRKLLPPNQRIYLTPIKVQDAVSFRPSTTANDAPTLARLVQDIPFHIPGLDPSVQARLPAPQSSACESPTLHDFLFASTPASYGTLGPEQEFYHGRRFLERPLRELVDLWLTLEKTTTGTGLQADRLHQFRKRLHFFCRDVLRAEATLPLEAGRRLRGAFDLDPDISSVLTAEPLHLVPTMYPPRLEAMDRQTPVPEALDDRLEWTVRVQGAAGWELRSDPTGTQPNALFLGPATTSLIIFYSDLLTLFQREAETNLLFDVNRTAWRFAHLDYHFQRGTVQAGSWPFPNVLTFWDADRFLSAWTKQVLQLKGLSAQSDPPQLMPVLVFLWIGLGAAALSGKAAALNANRSFVTEAEWRTLQLAVEALYNDSRHSTRVADSVLDWILRAMSLLNADVLGSDNTPRKVFGESRTLKLLCQSHGKRFIDWKAWVTGPDRFKNVDEQKFREVIAHIKPWWMG
jgi:hypothetical protein